MARRSAPSPAVEPQPGPAIEPAVKAADAYHHGDLRAALVGAAREALETAAPEAITLKSLAVRLGVSQPAPYRHFQNREALLNAVAADGFARFRDALVQARDTAPTGEAFERACLAYLAFGRGNMGVYRLMFASRLATSDDAALEHSSQAAFDFLLQGVGDVVPAERVYVTAVWIWSTLHGLVMLEAERLGAGPDKDRTTPDEVVRQMIGTLKATRG
jgi:AcrR family transcriptional regulator